MTIRFIWRKAAIFVQRDDPDSIVMAIEALPEADTHDLTIRRNPLNYTSPVWLPNVRLAFLPEVLMGDVRSNQITEGRMDQTITNREFVKRHFEAVNRRDVQTVLGNMRPDLYDHELQGDHKNDLQEGAQRLQIVMKQVPDLTVDVRDVIADGDKVVVRAVWFGTDAVSQQKVEFHGFVQWRIVEGKLAERWATVTPIAEFQEGVNVW